MNPTVRSCRQNHASFHVKAKLRARLPQVSDSIHINTAMALATKRLLTKMELLENAVTTHFGATALWLMRAVSQASRQR